MNERDLMELENELFSPRFVPPPSEPQEEERVSYPGQYDTLEAVLGSKIRREVVLHTAPYQDARGTMRGWIKKEKRIWSLIVNYMPGGDDTGAIKRTVQNEMKLCNALLEYRDGVLWIPIESKKRLTGFEPGVRDATMNQVGNHLIHTIRNASKASTAFLDELTGFDFTRWRGAEQGLIRDFFVFQKEPASKLALQYMDEWSSKSEWAMSDDRRMAQMRLVDSVKALACRPNLDIGKEEEWIETTGACPSSSRRPRVLYHHDD